MKHRMALFVSGLITALVMVVAVGLIALSGQDSSAAQAQPLQPAAAVATPGLPTTELAAPSSAAQDSAEVDALRQQVETDRAQLQKAYSDLQQAYDEIQALQAASGSGEGGFRNGQRGRRSPGNDDTSPFGLGGDNG